MCILDLSKTLMYDFHNNYIKPKYGSKAVLRFADTDSLLYSIKTGDIYEDLYEDKGLFDNSDYKYLLSSFLGKIKKVIGKFKDETAGEPISEFAGLKSKLYAFTTDSVEKRPQKVFKKMSSKMIFNLKIT